MPTGELIKAKRRCREFGAVHTYQADEALAAALPPLSVPRMGDEARAALRAVIEFEKPPANGSMSDCLALAEARGFCADPRDWVPDFELPGRHLPLYQPWVDWIAENGLASFHAYNTLTAANWQRWKPKPLEEALRRSCLDEPWMTDIVLNHSAAFPAAQRELVLQVLSASRDENVIHCWQVPLIEHFLNDRLPKIRAAAQAKLTHKLSDQWQQECAEKHAEALARHLTVQNGRVSYAVRSEPHLMPFYREWSNTTFAALAQTLGLTAVQLAHGAELDFLDSQFVSLAARSEDVDVRTIIAQRVLATHEPSAIPLMLFRDLDPGLRQRMLEAQFKSQYWHSVQEFLGPERGFLTPEQMHQMSAYEAVKVSMRIQLEQGKPVNVAYDPLQAVAFSVGKEAAQELLDLVVSAGMKPDHPHLTMLRFNLAL